MVAIALANQKGGVGKTTITIGYAEIACALGLRVLVVDCDPQGNASAGLATPANENSLADILENEIELSPENADEYIQRSSWVNEISTSRGTGVGSIDVIAAHSHLATVETHLAADPIGAFDRLKRALESVRDRFDLILFDCPPSLGLLTINALFAADEVIIVSAPSAWSSDGVETFMNNVARIASRRDGKPHIAGIVVNNVGRTRDGKYWESEIAGRYDYQVETVGSRAAIAEAAAMSSPILSLGARPGAREAVENIKNTFFALIGLGAQSATSTQERSAVQSIAAAV
jgi:chromosome partitioning protein